MREWRGGYNPFCIICIACREPESPFAESPGALFCFLFRVCFQKKKFFLKLKKKRKEKVEQEFLVFSCFLFKKPARVLDWVLRRAPLSQLRTCSPALRLQLGRAGSRQSLGSQSHVSTMHHTYKNNYGYRDGGHQNKRALHNQNIHKNYNINNEYGGRVDSRQGLQSHHSRENRNQGTNNRQVPQINSSGQNVGFLGCQRNPIDWPPLTEEKLLKTLQELIRAELSNWGPTRRQNQSGLEIHHFHLVFI